MIRSYYHCCCINEPVIFSHCVHFKRGQWFHALLKVCSDRDDIVPLNAKCQAYCVCTHNLMSVHITTPVRCIHCRCSAHTCVHVFFWQPQKISRPTVTESCSCVLRSGRRLTRSSPLEEFIILYITTIFILTFLLFTTKYFVIVVPQKYVFHSNHRPCPFCVSVRRDFIWLLYCCYENQWLWMYAAEGYDQ